MGRSSCGSLGPASWWRPRWRRGLDTGDLAEPHLDGAARCGPCLPMRLGMAAGARAWELTGSEIIPFNSPMDGPLARKKAGSGLA